MKRGPDYFKRAEGGRRFFASRHPVRGYHGARPWRNAEGLEQADLSPTISAQRSKLTGRCDKGEGFEIVEYMLVEVCVHPRHNETKPKRKKGK